MVTKRSVSASEQNGRNVRWLRWDTIQYEMPYFNVHSNVSLIYHTEPKLKNEEKTEK